MVSNLLSLPETFVGEKGVPGTSNMAGSEGPFQRWYNFKEAFAPSFVEEVLVSMPHRVRACLDPFGGSGTTALTCQFLGVRPTTMEVSPFLADLIEAKLTTYDVRMLVQDRAALADQCAVTELLMDDAGFKATLRNAPLTFVEPGVDGRWIFDEAIARRIAVYRHAIEVLEEEAHRRLFTVLLGSVLIGVSNVTISGKGRRYRRNWQSRSREPQELDLLFEAAFQQALYDIGRYGKRPCGTFTLLRGDCRTRIAESEQVDLALFSPPYPNSFDYTDIYNVELWGLGYLGSGEDNRKLREATLRSHVQIKRQFAESDLGSPSLAHTLERLRSVSSELWNANIPGMVAAYFEDLCQVVEATRERLTADGHVVMVVGDSRYAGVLIDVPRVILDLAPSLGMRVVEVRPVRSMRSSPQHGGRLDLSESLIRLAPL